MDNTELLDSHINLEKIDKLQAEILVRRTLDLLKEHKDSDTFIFLSFSASPLEILIRNLWERLYEAPFPRVMHLNIGHKTSVIMDLNKRDSILDAVDQDSKIYIEDQLKKSVNITIVDDISISGKTETLSKNLIQFLNSTANVNYFPYIKSSQQGVPTKDEIAFFIDDSDSSSRKMFMPWKKPTLYGHENFVRWKPKEAARFVMERNLEAKDLTLEIEQELKLIGESIDLDKIKSYLDS